MEDAYLRENFEKLGLRHVAVQITNIKRRVGQGGTSSSRGGWGGRLRIRCSNSRSSHFCLKTSSVVGVVALLVFLRGERIELKPRCPDSSFFLVFFKDF